MNVFSYMPRAGCLLLGACFTILLAGRSQDPPAVYPIPPWAEGFEIVVEDGLTILRGPTGGTMVLASETGFVDEIRDGEVVRTEIRTAVVLPDGTEVPAAEYFQPQIPQFARMLLDQEDYVQRRERENVYLAPVVATLTNSQGGQESLELIAFQIELIRELIDQWLQEVQQMELTLRQQDRQQWQQEVAEAGSQLLRTRYGPLIADELTQRQMKLAWRWSPEQVGLLRMLSETPVGDALQLADQQKRVIRQLAAEAYREMNLELANARDEAIQFIKEVLTEKQLSEFEEFLGVYDHLRPPLGNWEQRLVRSQSYDDLLRQLDYRERLEQPVEIRHDHRLAFSMNLDLWPVLELMAERGDWDLISAVRSQVDPAKRVVDEWLEQRELLPEQLAETYANIEQVDQIERIIFGQISRRRRAFQEEIVELLLPHQIEQLWRWTPSHCGLVAMLTESPIGDALGLNEGQKTRLRNEALRLVEHMNQEIRHRTRSIHDQLVEILSREQRQRLERAFGDVLERFLLDRSYDALLIQVTYSRPMPTGEWTQYRAGEPEDHENE